MHLQNRHAEIASAPIASRPEWSLYGDGHVIAGTLVVRDVHIEAHILLDGQPLYRSRHMSWDVAMAELRALRGHWTALGWSEPN